MHTPFVKFDPLTFKIEVNTFKPSNHLVCCDNMLYYILFIKYFILNITKNVNFENSYLIEFCPNETIQIYF